MKARACKASQHQAQIPLSSMLCRAGLVFLFSAAALLSMPNTSATASPFITVTLPDPNKPFLSGQTVTVSGTGFDPGASIILWLDTNSNGRLDDGEPSFPLPIHTD